MTLALSPSLLSANRPLCARLLRRRPPPPHPPLSAARASTGGRDSFRDEAARPGVSRRAAWIAAVLVPPAALKIFDTYYDAVAAALGHAQYDLERHFAPFPVDSPLDPIYSKLDAQGTFRSPPDAYTGDGYASLSSTSSDYDSSSLSPASSFTSSDSHTNGAPPNDRGGGGGGGGGGSVEGARGGGEGGGGWRDRRGRADSTYGESQPQRRGAPGAGGLSSASTRLTLIRRTKIRASVGPSIQYVVSRAPVSVRVRVLNGPHARDQAGA